MNRRAVLLILAGLLSGCIFILDTGVKELNTELKGSCLKTKAVAHVYVSQCPAASGKYLISNREDSKPQCIPENAIQKLAAGTEMEVYRVMRQGRGSTGSCLRIEVIVKGDELPGRIADLPVCGIAHPNPIWITQGFDDGSGIIFNEDFISSIPCTTKRLDR